MPSTRHLRPSAYAGIAAVVVGVAIYLWEPRLNASRELSDKFLLSIVVFSFCSLFIIHVRAFAVEARLRGKALLGLSSTAFMLSISLLCFAWLCEIWLSTQVFVAITGVSWLIYFAWGGTFAIAASSLSYGVLGRLYALVGIGWLGFAAVALLFGLTGVATGQVLPLCMRMLEVLLLAIGSMTLMNLRS